jgi:hypothetical protein
MSTSDDEEFSGSERVLIGVMGLVCLPANVLVRTATFGVFGTGADKMIRAAVSGKRKDWLGD